MNGFEVVQGPIECDDSFEKIISDEETVLSAENIKPVPKSETDLSEMSGEAISRNLSSITKQNKLPKIQTHFGQINVKGSPIMITKQSLPFQMSSNTMSWKVEKTYPFAVYCLASFHQICVVTALLPLVTLFTCFVTAYTFQYDEVHETHCRVYNIIPSISAITGASPQRYFWRFTIALHIGPRLPIAFIYKNYYRSLLSRTDGLTAKNITKAKLLIFLILGLNCMEIISLGGVTYISNRENYPLHEKIFITFMVCSLCYMLATIQLNGILHNDPLQMTQEQKESIKWKKMLFLLSIMSTIGLLIFFAKHRFYCHDLAFTWFAFFEYLIAISNMLFHFTIVWDFPSQYMLVVQGSRSCIEEIFGSTSKKSQ